MGLADTLNKKSQLRTIQTSDWDLLENPFEMFAQAQQEYGHTNKIEFANMINSGKQNYVY